MNNRDEETVGETVGKRGKYPYYPLQRSLDAAAVVRDLGGANSQVAKSSIAHQLKADENSPSFTQILSAAKCFGLISGWGSYSLTDLGKDYFLPSGDGQKRSALIKAVKQPVLFEQLISRFDGAKIPASGMLANVIHRDFGVPESWSTRVASIFLSAVRDAGIIDSVGFLRYDAMMRKAGKIAPGTTRGDTATHAEAEAAHRSGESESSLSHDETSEQHGKDTVSADVDVWRFKLGNDSVRLETSRALSMAAWKKLNQYIAVLKPEDGSTKE